MSPKRAPGDSGISQDSKRPKGGGFSSIPNRKAFEERIGKLSENFPIFRDQFFQRKLSAEDVPQLDFKVQKALVLLASKAVAPFRHVMHCEGREKHLYMFFIQLFLSLRHGNLIVSAEGPEQAEAGDEEGPEELVAVKAKTDVARSAAVTEGLHAGLKAGCEAAMVVEVKGTVLYKDDIWQALAAGIELARHNRELARRNCVLARQNPELVERDPGAKSSCPAPVSVLLTDAMFWYFFSLQAVETKGHSEGPQAAGHGSRAAGASGSETGTGVETAEGTRGLEFTLTSTAINAEGVEEEIVETFRLMNCTSVLGELRWDKISPEEVVPVMYRIYKALYPEEDIAELPARVEQEEANVEADADAWVQNMVDRL